MTSEEYDKLTDKEKRIKVAEHSGKWMNCHITDDGIAVGCPTVGNPNNLAMLPNYLYDLNAMHEAVMSLTELDRERFWICVGKVILGGFVDHLPPASVQRLCQAHFEEIAEATAAQQAKAFVLTMTSNKKEEE